MSRGKSSLGFFFVWIQLISLFPRAGGGGRGGGVDSTCSMVRYVIAKKSRTDLYLYFMVLARNFFFFSAVAVEVLTELSHRQRRNMLWRLLSLLRLKPSLPAAFHIFPHQYPFFSSFRKPPK